MQPPPKLPNYIFLISDYETQATADAVAETLSKRDDTLLVQSFLTPIVDGLCAMLSEWQEKNLNRDDIVSLEKWFIDQYGPHALGIFAKTDSEEILIINDCTLVYRDATWDHIHPFITAVHNTIKPHQLLIVNLTTVEKPLAEALLSRYTYCSQLSTESIVSIIDGVA